MTALGHGLIELRMTTDPVELWAAIMGMCFNHSSDGITTEFGPAFNETLLLNVLQLQSDLISIH